MFFALITDRRVGLAGLNYRIFIKHCLWKKRKKIEMNEFEVGTEF